MYLKAVIFVLSFLATSAYPLHRNTREVTWTDSNVNQAYDKTELTKDLDKIYKSHIDGVGLYNQEEDLKINPMAEELQHKLNMESERLRIRLRQELAELRERLTSSPAHLSSTLASMRERLAPLTQQLQSSLSSNTQDLCGHLSLYLQGLETAEAQPEANPALYQEALHWMSQTLEHTSSKMADIITDFQTKTTGVMEHLKEISLSEAEAANTGLWLEMSSRLGREVSSLKVEAQSWVGTLKEELTALLKTAQPVKAQAAASIERFCQNAALESQALQVRMERLLVGLEEQLEVKGAMRFSPPSSSQQSAGSLQEDFLVKLSTLIQDILQSVQ